MAEIMGTGTDDELRRQQEAERAAREEQKRQEEQARQAEEQAKQAEADAKRAEEDAKAVQETAAASAPEAPEIPDMNAQFQADVDAQWANTKKKRGEQHFYTIEQQMAYEQENAVTPRAMRADEGWAEYAVDYSSIKTKDDLSLFMAGTEDDSQIVKAGYAWAKQNGQDPEEVLAYAEYYIYDQYGRELFKNPYSNGAKIRKANGVLSSVGLLNLDGEALDMDSASPSQIVSSIRMEADKKKHDAAADVVMAMCGIPGSPFYGMSISKDDLAFLDSADMTQKEFADITDGFKGLFTLADEPTKENAAAYKLAVLDIDGMDKPLRVKKQLYANLAEAYAERTGFVAPSAEDILAAHEQRMADEAGDPAEHGGGFLGWVKGLFTSEKAEKGESAAGGGKTPEELLAELKAQEKGTGYGGGSALTSSAPASSYAAAGSAPDKAESAVPGAVAPSPLDVPSGMEGREMQGPVQQESGAKPVYRRDIAYDPNMTDAQALAYYRSGATLDAANMQQIAWAVDDPDVVDLMVGDYGADAQNAYAARGIGVATPAQGGGYAAASGASAPKFDVMHAYRKFGSSIGNAAHMLSSGAMDAEMASEGYLALASVVREAKGLIENPENGIVIPKGVNQYDHVLSLYPDLANRVQGVLDAQKGVNEAYTQNALRAKEERQATLDSYTAQIQAGKGTPEMAAAVAAAYGGDYADIEDDETRAVFRFNLSERSGYFRDDGAFWQGDSAAAQEGQRLRQMGRGYGEYKADLKAETERLIDEYATAAHKMGLPLEQFLAGAGIDGVGQMIDIAYNAMQAEGNAYRDDPQAQEAMEVLETTSVGKLGAAGYGAAQGVVGTTAGYAQTLYMALDEMDYHEAVANLTEEYTTKYGPSAPQMYFSDVMAYANSGALSKEATEELLDKASRAANIFDLGFEIDTNLLEGAARLTYNELQKVNEQLEGVIARMPEDERRIATLTSSFVGSIEEGMVALTVGKAAGVLGAGAKAANLIGSAVGFGAPSFSATYDEGRQMGMSPGMAGRRAFGRSVVTSALNTAGTGTQMDIWFGETGYRGMLDALRSGGKEVAKTMGRAVLRSAHQEGKEELEELAAEKVFDLMDDDLLAIDRGAKPSISRMLSSMTTGLMQTDVRALAAEAVESYGMGAAFGSVFTLGGLAKTARSAKRGLNKLTQYESVGLADRMVTGDAAFTEENMGKVFAALQKDLEDPKFRRWLDSADMAARDQNATVTAMLLGTGEAERNAAVDAAGKAAEYGEKAKAAKTASDVAKDHFFEIGARVERGEAKGSEMDAALAQMQKADTALTEAQNAADKAAELAAQKASEWLRACRAQGVTIRAADMQRRATVMEEMLTQDALELSKWYEAEAEREARAEEEARLAEAAVFGEEDTSWADEPEESGETAKDEPVTEAELVYAGQILEAMQYGAATDDEADTVVDIRVRAVAALADQLDHAREVLATVGDAATYNGVVEAYNAALERTKQVFPDIKNKPLRLMAEPELRKPEPMPESEELKAWREEKRKADALAERHKDEAERFALGDEDTGSTLEPDLSVPEKPVDVDALLKEIDDAEADLLFLDERAENILTGEQIAEHKQSVRGPLAARKKRAIEQQTAAFNELFDQMMAALEGGDEDVYNQLSEQYEAAGERLRKMGVDTDALIMAQYGVTEADLDKAEKEAEAREAEEKAKAEDAEFDRAEAGVGDRKAYLSAKLEALTPVRKEFMAHPIYVNASQKADLLSAEGLKSLTQFNRRYGTKLTDKPGKAIPLDGGYMMDIDFENPGVVNGGALPHEEMLRVLREGKRLADERKALDEEARALDEKRRKAKEARKSRIQARMGASGVPQRAEMQSTEPVQAKADAAAETNEQADVKKEKKPAESALKAVEDLAKEIGVGLRVKGRKRFGSAGFVPGKRVLGYYQNGNRNAIVRSTQAGDVSVTGHEIGHAVQEQIGLSANDHMVESWKREFGAVEAYAEAEYGPEAFAEFFWRYLKGREVAEAYAGSEYVDTFEQALRQKGMLKAVQKAQAKVTDFAYAAMTDKVGAVVVDAVEAKKRNKPTPTEWLRTKIARVVDDTSAIEPMQDVVRARTGKKHLSIENNVRDVIRFNRFAQARGMQCLTEKMVDGRGNVVGESLKDALSGLKAKDFDLYWDYVLVNHSLSRDMVKGEVNQVFSEADFPTKARQAFVAKTRAEHPEFDAINERVQAWRRLFMETYLVDNGFLGNPEMASMLLDELENKYPFYAPTYRVKSAKNGTAKVGGKTYKAYRATGSTEDILHPFDSFVNMVSSIVQMAADNDSRKAFARMYDQFSEPLPGEPGPGVGLFANEITQDFERVEVSTANTLKRVVKLLSEIDGMDIDTIMKVGQIIGTEKAEYKGTHKVNMNNVITVRGEDGRQRYFEIYNPELYSLLAGSGAMREKTIVTSIGRLTRVMSMLTTGSNPVFAVTNAMRDFQSSVNYGTWATGYADGAVKWLGALWDVMTNGEASTEMQALGGGGWQMFDTATKKGSAEIRGAVVDGYRWKKGQRVRTIGRGIWKAVTAQKVNEWVEQASRVAEYKYGKHDRATESGRMEGLLAAQDVTTDFTRHGSGIIARELKALVPFSNPSMQGVYRMGRQATAQESDRASVRFAKTVVNTAIMAAIANSILLDNLDDEEKEDFIHMTDDLMAKHIFLPNPDKDFFGDAPLLRIPLAQDPVVYAVNAAMANFVWSGETDNEVLIELGAVADVIRDNLNPIGDSILAPALAMKSNTNWYGGRIVPTYLEGSAPENQYTEETPTPFVQLAQGMAKMGIARVSPMMLQYIAEQYTGFIGQTIIPALPTSEKGWAASNLLTSLTAMARKRVTTDPLKSTDAMSGVYDAFTEMSAISRDGKKGRALTGLRGDLTETERRMAIREADEMTHKGGVLYDTKAELKRLDERMDEINAMDSLTDEEKQTMTRSLRRQKIDAALDAQEVVNDYKTRYMDNSIVKRFIEWAFGQ